MPLILAKVEEFVVDVIGRYTSLSRLPLEVFYHRAWFLHLLRPKITSIFSFEKNEQRWRSFKRQQLGKSRFSILWWKRAYPANVPYNA